MNKLLETKIKLLRDHRTKQKTYRVGLWQKSGQYDKRLGLCHPILLLESLLMQQKHDSNDHTMNAHPLKTIADIYGFPISNEY